MAGRFEMLRTMGALLRLWPRVLQGVRQDVRQRYVGSLFGAAWAVLFPLLQLSVYAGLYVFVLRVRPSGLTVGDYIVLVFSGLVSLMAFNEVINATTNSLTVNKSLLLNTVFPAELIPVRAALAAQVPPLCGLLIVLIAGYTVGQTSWQAILLVPVFWVLLLMFAMGIGWMLSLLSLVIKDIQHVLGIVLMMVTMLSPFAYTPDMVPALLKPIIYMNPMSYFVMTFQKLICYGTWPDLPVAAVAAMLGIGLFLAGFAVFQKAKRFFFDYV